MSDQSDPSAAAAMPGDHEPDFFSDEFDLLFPPTFGDSAIEDIFASWDEFQVPDVSNDASEGALLETTISSDTQIQPTETPIPDLLDVPSNAQSTDWNATFDGQFEATPEPLDTTGFPLNVVFNTSDELEFFPTDVNVPLPLHNASVDPYIASTFGPVANPVLPIWPQFSTPLDYPATSFTEPYLTSDQTPFAPFPTFAELQAPFAQGQTIEGSGNRFEELLTDEPAAGSNIPPHDSELQTISVQDLGTRRLRRAATNVQQQESNATADNPPHSVQTVNRTRTLVKPIEKGNNPYGRGGTRACRVCRSWKRTCVYTSFEEPCERCKIRGEKGECVKISRAEFDPSRALQHTDNSNRSWKEQGLVEFVYSVYFEENQRVVWEWFAILRMDAGKPDLPTILRETLYAVAAFYHPDTDCREQFTDYHARAIRALKRRLTSKVEATESDLVAAAVLTFVTRENKEPPLVRPILLELMSRFQRHHTFSHRIGALTRALMDRTLSYLIYREHLPLSTLPILPYMSTFSQRLQYPKISGHLSGVPPHKQVLSTAWNHIYFSLSVLIGCMRLSLNAADVALNDRRLLVQSGISEIVTEVVRQVTDRDFLNCLSDIRLKLGSYGDKLNSYARFIHLKFDLVKLLIMNELDQVIAYSTGDESVLQCLDWIKQEWHLHQDPEDDYLKRYVISLLRLGSCFVSNIAGTNSPFDSLTYKVWREIIHQLGELGWGNEARNIEELWEEAPKERLRRIVKYGYYS